MKALPSVLFFACFASTAFADSSFIPLSPRAALFEELKNQFKDTSEPGTSSVSALPISHDEAVVRLKPFIVTAYTENRALPAILQQQELLFKKEKFSLQNGGVLLLREGKVFTAELKLNFRVHGNGADLFRISLSW